MRSLTRVVVPMCGLLIGASLLGAIAVHEHAAEAITGPRQESIEVSVAEAPPVIEVETSGTVQDAAPVDRADPRQYGFVFTAGGATYVQISTRPGDMDVKHGHARVADDDGIHSAIAPVAAANLPAHLQDWIGKRVAVDGTCAATVVGFARVARLTGWLGYAGIDAGGADETKWTAQQVMDHGGALLAAKLDGCTGTWARDAALPPAIRAVPLPNDATLAARVRADLAKTGIAHAQRAQWKTDWPAESYSKHLRAAHLELRTVLHPTTGQRWVVGQIAEGETCGAPHLNVIAVYRMALDGTLTRVQEIDGEIRSIDQLVDVDGDGYFELRVMQGFVPDDALLGLTGEALSGTSVPFFGCPC